MTYLWRSLRGISLLALLTSFALVQAQDDTRSVNLVGSAIVTPLIEEMNSAAQTDIELVTETNGTQAGIQAFCEGTAPLAAATRTLSAEEAARCEANNIEFLELIVGQNILTVVANPATEIPLCLTLTDLNTLFVPSAAGQITNWSQVAEGLPEDIAVSLLVPPANTLNFLALDSIINGDGVRSDVTTASTAEILAEVSSSTNALGIVSLHDALGASNDVIALDIDFEDVGTGCAAPSAESVEDRLYSGADSFFLYANRAQQEELEALLSFVTSDDSVAVIENLGFTAPTAQAYEINRAILAGETGRQFGREGSSFVIPDGVNGIVRIGGAGTVSNAIQSMSAALSTVYPSLTAELNFEGEVAGVRRFCNGELDILVATTAFTADQTAACEANEITPISFGLGSRAVVLVANAADTYAQCFTPDQINFIWAAQVGDSITNWSQLGADYPDQDMTLFGIQEGSSLPDLLLGRTGEPIPPVRIDTEINGDPRYRAAATANVSGALTYMSWSDYQTVVASGQQNIQLVSVFDGQTCIEPSEASILSGEYSLTQSVDLIVSEASLNNLATRSVAWFIFSDENFSLLDAEGLIGLNFGRLPALREQLEIAFIRSDEAALTALTEAEQEPAPEATAESPSEEATAVPEATDEAE